MTTSSTEPRVVPVHHPELRSGQWTRLGHDGVLGDAVTEQTLDALATRTRDAARAQGYATGWAQGRRAALEAERAERERRELAHLTEKRRRDAEHAVAMLGLTQAAARLDEAVTATCAVVADQVVALAADLVAALLGHELTSLGAPAADAVRRALALAPAAAPVVVRVAPEEAHCPELAALSGGARVVADPALQRGDALVEVDGGVLDARVSEALARVREVLGS